MLSVDQIRNFPLFKDLSGAELEALAACIIRGTFVKRAYIFRPGDPAVNLYLVETGLVRVFFCNSQGNEFLLNLVGAHSVIGLPVKKENRHRLLGALAQFPTTLLSLSYEDLFRIAQSSKQLLFNMYTDAATSTGNLLAHYQSFVISGLEGRTAALFLLLGEGKVDEIDIPVSQADLASWLGVSRGRLNLTLIKFQKQGLIRLDGTRLFILNREGLSDLAEGAVLETL